MTNEKFKKVISSFNETIDHIDYDMMMMCNDVLNKVENFKMAYDSVLNSIGDVANEIFKDERLALQSKLTGADKTVDVPDNWQNDLKKVADRLNYIKELSEETNKLMCKIGSYSIKTAKDKEEITQNKNEKKKEEVKTTSVKDVISKPVEEKKEEKKEEKTQTALPIKTVNPSKIFNDFAHLVQLMNDPEFDNKVNECVEDLHKCGIFGEEIFKPLETIKNVIDKEREKRKEEEFNNMSLYEKLPLLNKEEFLKALKDAMGKQDANKDFDYESFYKDIKKAAEDKNVDVKGVVVDEPNFKYISSIITDKRGEKENKK